MNSLFAIGLLAMGAFEVTVSPDQPLPYSYTDDPLIVEVRSDEPCTARIELVATPDYEHPPVEVTLEAVTLGPDTSRWCAMKDLPTLRGPWDLRVSITVDGTTESLAHTAYRIDRPGNAFPHPLYAYGEAMDRDALLALRAVAVNRVAVSTEHPELPEFLALLASMDMKAIIRVAPETSDVLQTLTEGYCDAIFAWVLPLSPGDASTASTLELLRSLPCQKPVRLALLDGPISDNAFEMLSQGHPVVVEFGDALESLTGELESRGLNAVTVHAQLPLESVAEPGRFLPNYIESMALGARAVGFPLAMVYHEGKLAPGLAHVNGLMHRVTLGEYAGRIIQPGSTRAQIFSSGERWTAAAWREDDTSTVELPWSSARPFSVMDGWGNGIESQSGNSTWTHPLSQDFIYISGVGGPVLKTALIHRARASVRALTGDSALQPAYSETLRDTLNTIEKDPADISSRVQFFALLRAFPDIEERWHAGQLTRPVATTVLARLAKLARCLCQLEAAQGASFLEPLQDTLARCEEFLSAYLTGATATPQARARGDYIVTEVRRLMDEAEALAQLDRRIEADAVAALAEWRARALEFAAKAGPLSDQLTIEVDTDSDDTPEESEGETNKRGKKK